MKHTCPDCGVSPGEMHLPGCDVERCARCGFQAISCNCVYEVSGVVPTPGDGIYENGPTEAMETALDDELAETGGRLPWTGEWPGEAECREFGWYAKFVHGRGWIRCDSSDPEAGEDLNRLDSEGQWDRLQRRWVRRQS